MLATDCRIADSFLSRGIGLLFHSRLAEGEALRITKTSNITMFFMRFPIDAIFLDRRGTVVRAASDLRPWVLSIAARGAAEVVELRAGMIAESGTQAGDDLVFEDAQ
ncbi:MAG TPA: DUF192 domain-containing protein [Chloroflexi bacterium]|nr:DUF192 domain-containing protein [Chloroflexota bacterium]HAL27336.1 DUF192 domain-containing protein [Chloroflexota bacterium]